MLGNVYIALGLSTQLRLSSCAVHSSWCTTRKLVVSDPSQSLVDGSSDICDSSANSAYILSASFQEV